MLSLYFLYFQLLNLSSLFFISKKLDSLLKNVLSINISSIFVLLNKNKSSLLEWINSIFLLNVIPIKEVIPKKTIFWNFIFELTVDFSNMNKSWNFWYLNSISSLKIQLENETPFALESKLKSIFSLNVQFLKFIFKSLSKS